jgi:moderate conductance mechanosensitive channel
MPTPMSKRLKIKVAILVAIVVAGMIAMGICISTMQNNLSLENYTQEMKQEAQDLPDLLKQASEETEQNTKTYDALYQSKAESVSYIANNKAGYEATNSKMLEYKDLLEVDNVLVVDRSGKVVAQAQDSKADFSSSRFNRLRAVFDTKKASDAVIVDLDSQNWHDRYYSARIDDDTMVVIEQNPEELNQWIKDSGSTEAVLKNITIGQSGYMFAVSAKDYTIQYHPNSNLIGADILQEGFDVTKLEDGAFFWASINKANSYCNVTKIDDMYYISAVPESDISSARSVTTGVIVFAFFVVMAMVVLYGICVLHDEERRGNTEEDFIPMGSLRLNRGVARKGAILSFVGFVAIVAIAFYMQTLFALSSESVTNNDRVKQLSQTIQTTEDREKSLQAQYSEYYLDKTQVAAYVLDRNPELANHSDLQKLADVLQVQYVDVFNASGAMTATNSSYSSYTLSTDPKDSSYEFRKLLQGVDHVVQDARTDEISGDLRQYIGVSLKDSSGKANGFVQINVRPSRLENLIDSVKIDKVLDGVKVGSEGFAFAINKSDKTFAYYPDSKLQGKSALDYGMTEKQIKDGYSDYLTINGKTYYAASAEQGDYYLYVAGPEGELMAARGPLTLATAIIALICQLLIFVIVAFERRNAPYATATEQDPHARYFDISTPDGRKVKTESVASRWLMHGTFKWNEKTPEQKVASVMKFMVAVSVLAVFVAVLFRNQIFGQNSIFSYILGGNWERGLNIFALTASIMTACVAMTAAVVIQKILQLLAGAMGSRGETVCRLLGSFIKYATIIGVVYYCLALLGVDTTTLLASAGILSIAISLGAKELVSDILSGLFIIFEGEFRVGDIIQVGTWCGTVVEIGVRTTKVMNGSQNIKVIRNSNVSDVINMTKQTSYSSIDVGIEYSESLERVEAILADELPKIRESIPAIIDGPFYKGVVSLGESSVNIRVVVQCSENDRGQVERDMNRELKLLFDKYDIAMPFPQIVVNKPEKKRRATEQEKADSARFREEQREATRDIKEDEDSASK